MKTLLAVVAAAMALAGCVAVPVYDTGPAYGGGGYYYAPPAASFSFGYSDNHYRGRGHRHWR